MDQFGASPASVQPNSVLGSLAAGGQTPMSAGLSHFGAPFFSSLLQSAYNQGPPSVLTAHALNNPPNSVLDRWDASAMGPPSVMMANLGGSVANAASANVNSNYAEPHSVGSNLNAHSSSGVGSQHNPMNLNLIVPMTPLAGGVATAENGNDSTKGFLNGIANMLPPSNLPAPIPATPLALGGMAPIDVPSPTLQNIVSTVNLDCTPSKKCRIQPKTFRGGYNAYKRTENNCFGTVKKIFSSGKMVCTGAKSEETSRLAARKYARIIQKLGFDAKFTEFKVQNMVGSCDVKFPIQLEGLCITHNRFSTYEPELFPGLIYRMVKPRVVLLIFVSGKVVITGAKYRRDIDEAFHQIYPILKGFKK